MTQKQLKRATDIVPFNALNILIHEGLTNNGDLREFLRKR